MKINSIKIFSFITCFILLFSCEKLDLKPSDSIEPSKAFRNLEDINQGVLGAYAALDYDLISISTIVSDEIRVPNENTVSNTSAYRWIYDSSSGSVTSPFYMYYEVIDRVNRVLRNMELVEVDSSENALKERYKGELLALRAFAHFELLKAYSSDYNPDAMGIPYMKESIISYPPRDSFSSNIENINQDLSTAKTLIPDSFSDVTRISKAAVSAIQARVALYSKNWEDAVEYSTEAISKVPLASKEEFSGIWVDESDTGVIWKLARVTGDSDIGGSFFRQDGEIVLYAPSHELINSYDTINDIRFNTYISYEPERNDLNDDKSIYLVKKYIGNDPLEPGLTDIKLFRTAEMYLIRAEAYAELGNLTKASDDLNYLRNSRINNYEPIIFENTQSLITAIYLERFRALAFEGHRFFDLKRRNMSITRIPEDLINDVAATSLEPSQAQYTFPIPSTEIAVNENMEQNPKY